MTYIVLNKILPVPVIKISNFYLTDKKKHKWVNIPWLCSVSFGIYIFPNDSAALSSFQHHEKSNDTVYDIKDHHGSYS